MNRFIEKWLDESLAKYIDGLFPILIIVIVLFVLYRISKFLFFKLKEKKYQRKLSQSGIRDIDQMDGLQFEMYLKALFSELGYKTKVTTGSHDFGADLLLKRNGEKIVMQAKRYKYKSNVSLDAVQQIFTAKAYYHADQAWIITNSVYTKSANTLAKACDVTLLDRYKLVEFINKINPTVTPGKVKSTVQPEDRKCPHCNGTLTIRHSKQGRSFMGCSNFPECKHTENIAK